MSGRVRLKKIDLQRAGQLAQQGCRVIFYPDGSIAVEAKDSGDKQETTVDAKREIVL